MHRCEQILQAAAALIEGQAGLAAAVFQHRTLSLSADDQELPAVCVNQGPDLATGENGVTNLAFIDSVSELRLTLYAQGKSQQEVATELLRLRSAVHRALMVSPRTLNLAFVMEIYYGGAGEPEYTKDGSPLAGQMECAYRVPYRMNLTDPET